MADNNEEKLRLAKNYYNALRERQQKINTKLSASQRAFFDYHGYDTEEFRNLEAALRDPHTIPSKYIARKMGWLFRYVIPRRDKEVVMYFADRLQEYPYSDSYTRRSFRARDNGVYAKKLYNIISRYYNIGILDEPLGKILERKLSPDAQAFLDQYSVNYGCAYTEWQVAYALDRRDKSAESAVRRILTEENGSGMMTTNLIAGVLISHRTDFHELLGKLLIAARLQEGLRQAICESADCGTKSAFLTILKVIAENDLIRYSSVKRAVGTWLGILTLESRNLDRVSAKSLQLIINCLTDEEFCKRCLSSEDAMEIYTALWRYGLDDIKVAAQKIEQFAESGPIHQLLVAGYFIANIKADDTAHRLAKKIIKKYADEDKLLAVWLPFFLPERMYAINIYLKMRRHISCGRWFESKAELNEYYQLIKKLYISFSGKTKTFSPCIFPWYEAKIEKSSFAQLLCTMALLSGDNDKLDEACGFIKECDSSCRDFYFTSLLSSPATPAQRKAVLEGLIDRETLTRQSAYKSASLLALTAEEYQSLEDYLRFKGADIRNNVTSLLLRQNNSALTACIARLLESNKEDIRLGGLDMLLQLKKNERRSNILSAFTKTLSELAQSEGVTSKEKLLLESLLPRQEKQAAYGAKDKYVPTPFDKEYLALCEKTFRQYFPDSVLPALIGAATDDRPSGTYPCPTCQSAEADLRSLSSWTDEHKTIPLRRSDGELILLGNVQNEYNLIYEGENLFLPELWKEWIKTNSVTKERLLHALVLLRAYTEKTRFSEACSESIRKVYGAGFERGTAMPYQQIMNVVLSHLVLQFVPREERTQLAAALAVWFVRCVPDNMIMVPVADNYNRIFSTQSETAHLIAHNQLYLIYEWLECKNTPDLKYTFPIAVSCAERCVSALRKLPKEKQAGRYYLSDACQRKLIGTYTGVYTSELPLIGTNSYLAAAFQGIISEAQLLEFLLAPENIKDSLRRVTTIAKTFLDKGKQISSRTALQSRLHAGIVKELLGNEGTDEDNQKLLEYVCGVYNTVIPIVLASELRRGDSPATYSGGIVGIARIYGANYFAEILSAMGSDTIDRTVHYDWKNTSDRRSNLSHLLSVCIPRDDDTVDTLCTALAGKNISAKRLIEAALFSPEWIALIGKYLKVNGFESACYYFIAHMNEQFDEKRKAMIARYTPLSEDELHLGAFDLNWFRAAYEGVGEKQFNLIYNAAKYITDGAKHTRARKFADAALGKLSVQETEATIEKSRNKDLLMAYALIPLSGEDDLCRRYLYLQQFLKESRKFGSQRAASEGKAVETALTNLAINAGYSDSMRLTLRMENKVMDDRRALLEEQTVDGVSFRITFDCNGKAALVCTKDSKPLKGIPSGLKKNETVIKLNETVKALTGQYRRARVMLERAMEACTVFTFEELSALSTHPVVYPMLKKLVLISGKTTGFLSGEGLADYDGNVHIQDGGAEVRIAHPYDLYENGCWRNYQKYLFDRQTVQPFRQVFRELYLKTTEEEQLLHSLRYSGNQIQPAKAVSVLKGRRWVADPEDGLQKVYYKQNIVAQIYALADWFSPADIESPTLEWVCFTDRKTGETIKIADIPNIIFSEVMRDVDLAVSVAHAGGVDPETSHSTIEMRADILSYILPMFRINNVKIENTHAIIDGKLAQYSVHLGSGVVHQTGGAMIPVLPVHSQHRGKIFLPFVDDDPKTAEIISKILLFAEDDKIKDPMILSNITR